MSAKKETILLFVEGDSDKEFYEALFAYYKTYSKTKFLGNFKVINVKGIGRFEIKVPSKLKNELLTKYRGTEIVVFCCHDNDVFEFAEKPPTNWGVVKEKVNKLPIPKFSLICASNMIEDWFLHDIRGLCKFLKLTNTPKVKGKNGYEKMKLLFKKGNKTYQKGSTCHKFVPMLDISTIRGKIKDRLLLLEEELGVNLPGKK